jgi:hypothetical protein
MPCSEKNTLARLPEVRGGVFAFVVENLGGRQPRVVVDSVVQVRIALRSHTPDNAPTKWHIHGMNRIRLSTTVHCIDMLFGQTCLDIAEIQCGVARSAVAALSRTVKVARLPSSEKDRSVRQVDVVTFVAGIVGSQHDLSAAIETQREGFVFGHLHVGHAASKQR